MMDGFFRNRCKVGSSLGGSEDAGQGYGVNNRPGAPSRMSMRETCHLFGESGNQCGAS
jgi:hypothetical protein